MYQFFAKQMLLKCVVLSAFILGDLANVAMHHDGSVRIGASASYAQDSGDAGAAAGETVTPDAPVATLAATDADVPEATGADQTSSGDLSYPVPISVPGFRGIEPSLGLSYRSRGAGHRSAGSVLGAGWVLNGFSEIRRASKGRGLPFYIDEHDSYMLDSEELILLFGYRPRAFQPRLCHRGRHLCRPDRVLSADRAVRKWSVGGHLAQRRCSDLSTALVLGRRNDHHSRTKSPAQSQPLVAGKGPRHEREHGHL